MRNIVAYIAGLLVLAAVAGQARAVTVKTATGTVNLAVVSSISYTPNPTSVVVTITKNGSPVDNYIGGTIKCNVPVNIAAAFTPPTGSPPVTCTWTYSLNHTTAAQGTTTFGTTSGNYLVNIHVSFGTGGGSWTSYSFPAITVSQHSAGTPPAGNLYITLSAS